MSVRVVPPSLCCAEGDLLWRGLVCSYRTIVTARYRLLRELLLFMCYAVHVRVHFNVNGTIAGNAAAGTHSGDALFYLESEAIPRTLSLIKQYRLYHWIGQISHHFSVDAVAADGGQSAVGGLADMDEDEAATGVAIIKLPNPNGAASAAAADRKGGGGHDEKAITPSKDGTDAAPPVSSNGGG
jgi:hypothetical protein